MVSPWVKFGHKAEDRSFSLFPTSTIIPVCVLWCSTEDLKCHWEESYHVPHSLPTSPSATPPKAHLPENHIPCSRWPCLDYWHLALTSHPSSRWEQFHVLRLSNGDPRILEDKNSTDIHILIHFGWSEWNGLHFLIYHSNRLIPLSQTYRLLKQETALKDGVQLLHFAVWETGV